MLIYDFEYVPIIIKYVEPVKYNGEVVNNNFQKYTLNISNKASHSYSVEQILPNNITVPLLVNGLTKLELARPLQDSPQFRYKVKYLFNGQELAEQYWILPRPPLKKQIFDLTYKEGGVKLPDDVFNLIEVYGKDTIYEEYELNKTNTLIIPDVVEGTAFKIMYQPGVFVYDLLDNTDTKRNLRSRNLSQKYTIS